MQIWNRRNFLKTVGAASAALAASSHAGAGTGKRVITLTADQEPASPVAANGHVYLCGLDGWVVVVRAGEKLQKVSSAKLDDRMVATPGIAGDTIYIRTNKTLYAFAESLDIGGAATTGVVSVKAGIGGGVGTSGGDAQSGRDDIRISSAIVGPARRLVRSPFSRQATSSAPARRDYSDREARW